jgi:hypothetical protein
MKLTEEPMTSIELKDGTVSAWVTNRWSLPGHSGEPVVRAIFRSRYDGTTSAVHLELSASEVDDLVVLLANHKRQLAQS